MGAEDGSKRRRRRTLKRDERELWTLVTRTVAPLRPSLPEPDAPAEPDPVPAPDPRPKKRSPVAAPAVVKPRHPPSPPALEPLDRRARQKLTRGTASIDGRLDLHGRTQAEAYDALFGFLRRSQAGGARVVLVITGKGRETGNAGGERGVLRRQVPLWLGLPAFRTLVIGFDFAGIGHGGEGALYVRLRRSKGD